MQEHEINVAVRIQFRATKTTDGHQRDRREFFLPGQFRHRRVPQMPQEPVEDCGAGLADFHAVRAGAVQQLQPVRLDLEEVFVARELFRRRGVGRKGQPRLGGGLDFFEQVLHGRKS